ncbi:MAG TPA: cation:proton antiporter [Pseudorhodoplanes sp.]|nr:cation:proton antiporter [Pseudorhodoplanes sp.]
MLHTEGLRSILVFLIAAGIIVPLLHRLRLGTVLGFILIGLALGPYGLGLLADRFPFVRYVTFDDPARGAPLAELGIVFLLFLLGMELSVPRLWQLRRYVLGVGALQVLGSTFAIGALVRASGITPPAGIVLGMCFALSSTAIVMQLLIDQRRAAAPVGRVSLSVLLFQDLMVVPVLFIIGILEARTAGERGIVELLLPFAEALGAVVVIMAAGRYVVTPLMRSAARTGSRELIMAITLVIVVGISAATGISGLSVALGAFLAGLLLSDSEYRHQIEVDLDPFKGLLLGIFFVTVGMSVELEVVWANIGSVLLSLAALISVKAAILYGAARLFRVPNAVAAEAALLLAQAGEFAFIVIGLARSKDLLPPPIATSAIAVAGLSMMVTPLLAVAARRLGRKIARQEQPHAIAEDSAAELRDHVVIGGFGRVGQTVARVLDSENVPWVALDTNGEVVTEHRQLGRMVFFGDASRNELIERAGAKRARAFVVTLSHAEAAERMVAEIRKIRPGACLLVRARDSEHAARLLRLGATDAVPETVEASLQLAGRLLENLDFPEDVADRRIADIRMVEMELLRKASRSAAADIPRSASS